MIGWPDSLHHVPWGPQKQQLFQSDMDPVDLVEHLDVVLQELKAENPMISSEAPLQVSGTIRYTQKDRWYAKFSQPIRFVIEIVRRPGGGGTLLSIAAQGGDVAGTASEKGVELLRAGVERKSPLTVIESDLSASEYAGPLHAESFNKISLAALTGGAFEAALEEGVFLEPGFWVNRAMQVSPWDEGAEAVEKVRAIPGPLNEEHEVGPAAMELQPRLEAAERGELDETALRELHEAVTLMIRWTFMAAARWLISRYPAGAFGDTPQEAEKKVFGKLRYDMRHFDNMLIYKRTKGEKIPLMNAVGGACFEILSARNERLRTRADQS